MNIDIFTDLKTLKADLDCEMEEGPKAVNSIKSKCLEALQLIEQLSFNDNSPHVQLATRHSIQYLQKALSEIDSFFSGNTQTRKNQKSLRDICAPAHAGLEIILNLNYE